MSFVCIGGMSFVCTCRWYGGMSFVQCMYVGGMEEWVLYVGGMEE